MYIYIHIYKYIYIDICIIYIYVCNVCDGTCPDPPALSPLIWGGYD